MQRRTLFLAAAGFAATRVALGADDVLPTGLLALAEGEWRGTLTTGDPNKPGGLTAVKSSLTVALLSPTSLALHYTYDQPGRTVHSYERMAFDLRTGRVRWTTAQGERLHQVVRNALGVGGWALVMEAPVAGGRTDRHTLLLSEDSFSLRRDDFASANGELAFRSELALRRRGE